MSNKLANETSPYLLQHANNPVEWYPWGDEALNRAKLEDKAIFLSIGYSACHWCHVMENESFTDPNIAALMNSNFINIKVDREERPDIDSIYMTAIQSMRGQGGWPLSMFLTPDGEPFYGGTYFPPQDRHGMPAFSKVLLAVADAYRNKRESIEDSAKVVKSTLEKHTKSITQSEMIDRETYLRAYGVIENNFDSDNGGFGSYPKFPQPMALEFLLRYYNMNKLDHLKALDMVNITLEHMAKGGIYDHLGGGFHRYSTDASWLVPHFEKMLYDNALISQLYTHAFQVTGNNEYKRIATETLDYILREMTDGNGGFYSAQDADSEGSEGKFFVWSFHELRSLLDENQFEAIREYFSIEENGNFEGSNILHSPLNVSELAKLLGKEENSLTATIESAKNILMDIRASRIAPDTDRKILTSWNGLMINSLVLASAVFQREDYLRAAQSNARFILDHMRHEGRLMRSYKDNLSNIKGFLEDYASLSSALLSIYEFTLEPDWFKEAKLIADDMLDLFWDSSDLSFYDTGIDQERLIVRPRNITDNAMPCGASMATNLLLKLSVLTGDKRYKDTAMDSLKSVQNFMGQIPIGFGHWLEALDFYLSSPKEIALIGDRSDTDMDSLVQTIFSKYIPNKVLAGFNPNDESTQVNIPLLQDKEAIDNKPTVHICKDYFCLMPITSKDKLLEQLEEPDTGILRQMF